MKILVLLQICILICLFSFSQTNYYYADGQQIYWITDSSSANIIVKNTENYSQIANKPVLRDLQPLARPYGQSRRLEYKDLKSIM